MSVGVPVSPASCAAEEGIGFDVLRRDAAPVAFTGHSSNMSQSVELSEYPPWNI